MIKKKLIFAIVFILLIIFPVVLNQFYNYLLVPVSKIESPQIFVVKPGQSVRDIAENLSGAKLVKSALAFRLLVAEMSIAKTIQAGDFRFSPNLSSRQIAEELTHGAIDIWITLPEGLRIEEQAQIIESKLRTSSNDNYQFDKKEYITGAREGYMFPDTYLISKDAAASDVINRLKGTFSQKVDAKILAYGAKNNLSEDEVVILASLVEKEAKTDAERPIIAGILLNRLKMGMVLQVDATVSYAKGYDSAKNTWWSAPTMEDYKFVKSPYNTYLVSGLPPKPIANAGLESIRAAAEPAETDYLYYLHDSEGKIHYAKTVDEHNRNIQEFL